MRSAGIPARLSAQREKLSYRFAQTHLRALFKCSSSMVFCGLPGLPPWQTPQSMHREDRGEDSEHADQEQRIDEEEVPGGVRHAAGEASAFSLHVAERARQREKA